MAVRGFRRDGGREGVPGAGPVRPAGHRREGDGEGGPGFSRNRKRPNVVRHLPAWSRAPVDGHQHRPRVRQRHRPQEFLCEQRICSGNEPLRPAVPWILPDGGAGSSLKTLVRPVQAADLGRRHKQHPKPSHDIVVPPWGLALSCPVTGILASCGRAAASGMPPPPPSSRRRQTSLTVVTDRDTAGLIAAWSQPLEEVVKSSPAEGPHSSVAAPLPDGPSK
ncbi:uncharacterized protein [Phaenicophaeus curvirostris]|uniref:uncharacterized protein n=1 Tax=Phaenicophaeus curvirostris TaxID=33595 RepID=UPI0037F0ECD5